jgi:hypothetical protein
MPAVGGAGVPSLSQILSWDTTHLSVAATEWVSTAELWEEVFSRVDQGTLSPGGTVWKGETADAVRERAFTDLVNARGLADTLSEAAAVARRGVDQLDYLKRHRHPVRNGRPLGRSSSQTRDVSTSSYAARAWEARNDAGRNQDLSEMSEEAQHQSNSST